LVGQGELRPITLTSLALDPCELRHLLDEHGVIILRDCEEDFGLTLVARAELIPLKQYETVRAGADDPYVLTAVAERNGAGITPSTKPGPTLPHQDAYQWWSEYRGEPIAGVGRMPDTEVLFYPAVEERRLVVVHGLAAAAHAVAEEDLRWTSFGKDSAAVVGGTAAQCSAVRFSRRDQILPAVAAAEAHPETHAGGAGKSLSPALAVHSLPETANPAKPEPTTGESETRGAPGSVT